VICTYALCGFANVGSIGIVIGALGALAPTRKKDITKVVIRAMIAGNVACFMTACIAGKWWAGLVIDVRQLFLVLLISTVLLLRLLDIQTVPLSRTSLCRSRVWSYLRNLTVFHFA